MSLKIASWNIEGRLSVFDARPRGNSTQIMAAITALNADVLVLLEAHSEDSVDTVSALPELRALGYHVLSVPYQDDMAFRTDSELQSSLMLLSKLPVRNFETIRLGRLRNGLAATIGYEPGRSLRVIGIHLDDRSEETRLQQVADLSGVIRQTTLPTVVLGDFNAMHGGDLWPSQFLQSPSMRLLSRLILPSLSQRAIGMARGEALLELQAQTGLIDADPKHQPTSTPKMRGCEWMPSVRLIQIDHMFVSSTIVVNNFAVARDGGADHRAISANVSFK
jgi:endonuclease/exonuclease/phosphatase family metal-dependent hydrolase